MDWGMKWVGDYAYHVTVKYHILKKFLLLKNNYSLIHFIIILYIFTQYYILVPGNLT